MRIKIRLELITMFVTMLVIGIIVCSYNSNIDKVKASYEDQITEMQNDIDKITENNETLSNDLAKEQAYSVELFKKNEEVNASLTLAKEENLRLLSKIKEQDDELKYYEEVCDYIYNSHWNAIYTEEDVKILAGVMYGEEYPDRYEMMLAGSVVLNRVLSPNFPNSVKEVVYQFDGKYEQYAPRTKRLIGSSEITEECYRLAEMLLQHGPICPPYVLYQAHFNQGTRFWDWKGEEFCYKKADKEAYEKSLIKEEN